jgi:tellurium resistance protein TerD
MYVMSEQLVSLEKGAKVDLTKTNPNLSKVNVGMGWDVNASGGQDYDLDAFGFYLGTTGKLTKKEHICFFGNKDVPGMKHGGDNLTGAGDGDDETIEINLSNIPTDVEQVILAVNIYKADERGHQKFGFVKNGFVRLYDAENPTNQLAKYDLSEDYASNTGVIMGKLYRHDGQWKFQALGEGKNGDINTIVSGYVG